MFGSGALQSRDHPRMRGEHQSTSGAIDELVGSSPHARGVLACHTASCRRSGIIPACAGSTRAPRWRGPCTGDHPRMRGEHCPRLPACSSTLGSSPHARGAQPIHVIKVRVLGIVPACAGSTSGFSCKYSTTWDHPRMRGEHLCGDSRHVGGLGSSPHARGARLRLLAGPHVVGIIPACAGSTAYATSADGSQGDHPRMRGEHLDGAEVKDGYQGSSPHARGAPMSSPKSVKDGGIIPACAGSTPSRS